jgi:hypothetical protein
VRSSEPIHSKMLRIHHAADRGDEAQGEGGQGCSLVNSAESGMELRKLVRNVAFATRAILGGAKQCQHRGRWGLSPPALPVAAAPAWALPNMKRHAVPFHSLNSLLIGGFINPHIFSHLHISFAERNYTEESAIRVLFFSGNGLGEISFIPSYHTLIANGILNAG